MAAGSPVPAQICGGSGRSPLRLYEALARQHGPQRWWPGDTAFEIAVGAVLVQRTAWHNAAAAIAALRQQGLLRAGRLAGCRRDRLEDCIRPAGFYRAKAACLQRFCEWLEAVGGFDGLGRRDTSDLRAELLSLKGIGPETADCILLYALGRPVFVIDAYTRRVLSRTGLCPEAGRLGYGALQDWMEDRLPTEPELFNEYHALFVAHGKTLCRPVPRCGDCGLAAGCNYLRSG